MDNYLTSIFKRLTDHFPDLEEANIDISGQLELSIPAVNNASIGGLVVQTTTGKDIWLRNYHPYSAYSIDDVDELITIIEGVFADKILWAIGFKGDQWSETTLIRNLEDLETEDETTYRIFSWSGTLDRTFKAN